RLEGKVAVVTGAARGMGHAVAELFADEGATVVATDVVEPEPYVGKVDFVHLDVTSEPEWQGVIAQVAETHGRLDVLVNNAGIIATPLTEAQDPGVNAYVIGMTPMGRAGKPVEVANGVLFLASNEASYVTGAELVIDGGYLAQ